MSFFTPQLIHLCFFVCAFVMANSSSDADSDPFYSFGGRGRISGYFNFDCFSGSYTGYGTGLIQGYRGASSYDRFGSYGSYGGYNAGGFGGVTASGQSYGRRWKGKRAAQYS